MDTWYLCILDYEECLQKNCRVKNLIIFIFVSRPPNSRTWQENHSMEKITSKNMKEDLKKVLQIMIPLK